MPDGLPAATLPIYPGLGQTQEYAGLHTPVAKSKQEFIHPKLDLTTDAE